MLTLAPPALGISRGAGLRSRTPIAIIFGLTAAVPLALLFLPALIETLGQLRRKKDEPLPDNG